MWLCYFYIVIFPKGLETTYLRTIQKGNPITLTLSHSFISKTQWGLCFFSEMIDSRASTISKIQISFDTLDIDRTYRIGRIPARTYWYSNIDTQSGIDTLSIDARYLLKSLLKLAERFRFQILNQSTIACFLFVTFSNLIADSFQI